jgi:hypothetical protein
VRRLAAIGVMALLLAGCGGSAEETASAPPPPQGDFGPTQPGKGERKRPAAPPLGKPAAAVAQALAGGTIGVVGVEGDVGVRPDELEVSADGTLEGLKWSDWSDSTARGTGELRLRDCDPSCASGGIDTLEATVELSSPRLCGRATYFDRARITIAGGEPAPTTYVRAPC